MFDQDGTIIVERPFYLHFYASQQRLKEMIAAVPSLADSPLYKSMLTNPEEWIDTMFNHGKVD